MRRQALEQGPATYLQGKPRGPNVGGHRPPFFYPDVGKAPAPTAAGRMTQSRERHGHRQGAPGTDLCGAGPGAGTRRGRNRGDPWFLDGCRPRLVQADYVALRRNLSIPCRQGRSRRHGSSVRRRSPSRCWAWRIICSIREPERRGSVDAGRGVTVAGRRVSPEDIGVWPCRRRMISS